MCDYVIYVGHPQKGEKEIGRRKSYRDAVEFVEDFFADGINTGIWWDKQNCKGQYYYGITNTHRYSLIGRVVKHYCDRSVLCSLR
jgi:phage terminase large subunit-like protein